MQSLRVIVPGKSNAPVWQGDSPVEPGTFHSLTERLPANHRSDFGIAGERDIRLNQLTHLLSCMRPLGSA